jgi:single-stranded-DNA-specific exonuclease
MQVLNKRWDIAPPVPPEINQELHAYPPLLRQLLYNRGYMTREAAHKFLTAQPPGGTTPFDMKGVLEAVDRIQFAIHRGERIAVYGDYDTDGVTATALLVDVLQHLGANVREYIPNRFDEGYGLNIEALNTLHQDGINLIITVDCGIRSLPEAEHALRLGTDLIISDHHHPGHEIPPALAVINPKQPGDSYPDKDLAGVGLAYKLAAALLDKTESQEQPSKDYLDLVAIGTVSDLAPLTGENRSLVKAGLERIRKPMRQGVLALIGVSGLKPASVTATDIGFALGPRLNAAGRLDSALAAFHLLSSSDVYEAAHLAQELDIQNRERQKITREIQEQAEQLALAEGKDVLLFFAAHPNFNVGVVGLAASRICEQYYRPAIVACQGEKETRGSCRSIPEFHITEALDRCTDLLERYGGHAAAAGFTVRNENLPDLIKRLKQIASEQLSDLDLRPTLFADVEIPLSDLKPNLLEYLDWLQPTGIGNKQAVFASFGLEVKRSQVVGKDGSHLKLVVTDGVITYDAIAFRQGHWAGQMPRYIDLMYTFEVNEFNGRETLQLNVRDIKPST